MRTLGVDFGLQRVGLALSDSEGKLAMPYETLRHRGKKKLVQNLLDIIELEGVQRVVLGLPKSQSGDETLGVRQVKNLARSLRRATGWQIYLLDETLSSYEAWQRLKSAGVRTKKQKSILDQQAAVLILENFLQHPEQAQVWEQDSLR
ncbi:MAG: Holliday junction resolvase RuvX [Desulfohalobiaceae bacterium]